MRHLLLSVALAALAAVPQASAQSVAGEWNATMNTPGGTREYKVILQVKGDSLTGTVKRPTGDVALIGTIKGAEVTFSYTIEYGGNPLLLTVTATVTGDAMKGSIDLGGGAQEAWSAKRAAAPPSPGAPALR
jgi:hypothetical protein